MSHSEPIIEQDWRVSDPFMQRHRGGAGNVWLTRVLNQETGEEGPCGVFGSWEASQAWTDNLDGYDEDDGWCSVSVPFVVDEPDFGNIPRENQQ